MWKDHHKKPNFFIIGAPKCGTTSIASWLGRHPRIYMCDPKEPHYFNTDSKHTSAFSLEEYESYFHGVDKAIHQAIGEASVWYLISDNAIDNILKFQTDARIIVCLRNPVEAAVSLHDQKLFSGDETEDDFWSAWNLQQDRKSGAIATPSNCMDVRELLYGESCLFGSLLQKLLQKIPRNQLHIILMDDLKTDPARVYKETLAFLNVEDDQQASFPVVNASKQRHIMALQRILRKVTILKQRLGIRRGVGVGKMLNAVNRMPRSRAPLDISVKRSLIDFFSEDIDVLQNLLNRNLQHWKEL